MAVHLFNHCVAVAIRNAISIESGRVTSGSVNGKADFVQIIDTLNSRQLCSLRPCNATLSTPNVN